MPKNFAVESIRHHVLRAIERAAQSCGDEHRAGWRALSGSLQVGRTPDGRMELSWSAPSPGSVIVEPKCFTLYRRGDLGLNVATDDPAGNNAAAADRIAAEMSRNAGLPLARTTGDLLEREQAFHDAWASSCCPEEVRVHNCFEAATAPENRYIVNLLGDVTGKRILDLGSGLGEASVYFALKNAQVTACDLSQGMLDIALRVAAHHGVRIAVHCAPAENTGLPEASFDVVYAANLLHHSDIDRVLGEVHRLLVPGGGVVSWDPISYNPLIKVYRRLASGVRTPDEHPLRRCDLDRFRKRFRHVEYRCFWLLTLALFLRFYLVEKVHPSKERYWKKILIEADRLAPFYYRLEKWDRRLLSFFPGLKWLCWNMVVHARK